jgi:hypothetical protein
VVAAGQSLVHWHRALAQLQPALPYLLIQAVSKCSLAQSYYTLFGPIAGGIKICMPLKDWKQRVLHHLASPEQSKITASCSMVVAVVLIVARRQ